MTTSKDVRCNACGRQLCKEESGYEDALHVRKEWGYFSQKDLQVHEWTLCEECYDKLIENFQLPVKITDKREALN